VANNGRTNGSNVQQYAANGCACQQWTVMHLDKVHQWTYLGAQNQQWQFAPVYAASEESTT
jgi:hypothetical protein